MNKIFILGNVGQDPEVRTIGNETKIAKITVAVTEKFRNKDGEKQESTTWFNVSAWRKTAEIVEKYITKGSKVLVEGKMTFRNYEDKDGVKRTAAEIQCENLTILSFKKDGSGGSTNHNDDLPF